MPVRALDWVQRHTSGGGNFGVVMSFEFQLHEMDRNVIAGAVVFPMERAKEVFRFYADMCASVPDELSLDLIMSAPPGESLGVVVIHAVWSGDHARTEGSCTDLETR